jgi:hypothetical protein
MERKVTTLKSLSKILTEEAAKMKADPVMEKIVRCVCEFADVSVSLQEDIVKNLSVQVPSDPDPAGAAALAPVPDQEIEVFTQYSQVASRVPKVVPAPVPKLQPGPRKDPKVQAFQDAVKHSERSTLIFNLNLGSKKTLNEKSILSQATLALSAAAAEVEGNKGRNPTREAVVALDDVMSVTQNVTLYGKVTRPYENKTNPQDPNNKTFFTMPIRYEFKDKDTRIEAETILRDTCNVDCATPYPVILRSCIKQVIDHFRKTYPNDYIKVQVDTNNLTLKVARKVKGSGWFDHKDPIKLPNQVLDIRARFVPKDFVLTNLPDFDSLSQSSEEDIADQF